MLQNRSDVEGALQAAAAAHNRTIQQAETLQRDLTNLRSSRSNPVQAFGGRAVTDVLRAIQSNARRFNRPPLGPIGQYLALSDQSCAVAVEATIGSILNAFIVHSSNDRRILAQIFG